MLYRYDSLGNHTGSHLGGGRVQNFESILKTIGEQKNFEEGTLELGVIIYMCELTGEQHSTLYKFRDWCEKNKLDQFTVRFDSIPPDAVFRMYNTATVGQEHNSKVYMYLGGNVDCCFIQVRIDLKNDFVESFHEFLAVN